MLLSSRTRLALLGRDERAGAGDRRDQVTGALPLIPNRVRRTVDVHDASYGDDWSESDERNNINIIAYPPIYVKYFIW